MLRVGTAGWSIPRAAAGAFPEGGTHLARYAQILDCVEINSSFYRPHAAATYGKWAAQTPGHFRFAVKLPKQITHQDRLQASRLPLTEFLEQVRGLGDKLGPLLVQLPPSLQFSGRTAGTFFTLFRQLHDGPIVCEPRHPSWFESRADALLLRHFVSRVGADPAVTPAASHPGGWLGDRRGQPPGVGYYRLHGSPRKYWSSYPRERLAAWLTEMTSPGLPHAWCLLDNTAAGAAIENALALEALAASL